MHLFWKKVKARNCYSSVLPMFACEIRQKHITTTTYSDPTLQQSVKHKKKKKEKKGEKERKWLHGEWNWDEIIFKTCSTLL